MAAWANCAEVLEAAQLKESGRKLTVLIMI